jgi:hypothetical protein
MGVNAPACHLYIAWHLIDEMLVAGSYSPVGRFSFGSVHASFPLTLS